MAVVITARSNERIKQARALLQAKERRTRGLHLIEGEKLLIEAVSSGCTPEEVFLEDGYSLPPELPHDLPVQLVSRSVLESLTVSATPQHVAAVVRTPDLTPPVIYPDGLAVVLDCVQDPGNVGTILRTADALGASCVLLGAGSADAFSGKTLRAAMGSSYHLPLYTGDAAAELRRMCEQGFLCIAGHLRGSESLPPLKTKTALVIGSEGNGVSDEVAALCALYRLPMRGRAESLNAAVAAALLLYELSNRIYGGIA